MKTADIVYLERLGEAKKSTTFAVVNEVGAYGRPKLQGVADSPKEAATKLNKEDNDYENACKHNR